MRGENDGEIEAQSEDTDVTNDDTYPLGAPML
jgi:hypothetical protein